MSTPVEDSKTWGNALSHVVNARYRNLVNQHGYSSDDAERAIIRDLLACAAGAACRRAIRNGRLPDPKLWRKAVTKAFRAAVQRVTNPHQQARPQPEPRGNANPGRPAPGATLNRQEA